MLFRFPRRSGAVIVSAALALALAACGGDDDSGGTGGGDDAPSTGTITLVTKEFTFEPDSLTVPAGETTVVVDNSGGVVEHDFTVDELDIAIHANPTDTVEETVTFETGTYDFYCSIPGHREAGMEGTLVVQ